MPIQSRSIILTAFALTLFFCVGCSKSSTDVVQPKLTEQQIQQIMEQEGSKARVGAGATGQPTGEASKNVPNLGLD